MVLADVAWPILAILVLGLIFRHMSISTADFRAFYASGLARRTGAVDPQLSISFPDLNPPTLGLLISPLTVFSLRTAFWIWTALGAASLLAALHAVGQSRSVSTRRLVWALGSAGLLMPCLAVWILGQVTWVLAYPLTRAWCATSRVRAGVWLGVAVALKPPLALMGLLLPWPIPGIAALVGGALSGGTIAWSGWAPWLQWLQFRTRVDWIGGTLNTSLWGWAARLQSRGVVPTRLSDLTATSVILTLLAGAVLVVPVLRARGDRRWLLAFWWSLLLSPLGWIYYLPMAIGPTLATWRWNVWSTCAFLLFLVPLPAVIGATTWHAATALAINSTYAVAFLLAWIGWAQPGLDPESESDHRVDPVRTRTRYEID